MGSNMGRLIHYYHCFAAGQWLRPMDEHFTALQRSGLYEVLDKPVRVGFIGNQTQIGAAKKWLADKGIEFVSVAEERSGWEQETQDKLYDEVMQSEEPFKVFYGHSKGASDPSLINQSWREDMISENIGNWKTATCLLETYDAVGIYWIHAHNFFAGTYFWANSDFIATLGYPNRDNRWGAEAWLRQNSALKIYDMRPGFPSLKPPPHPNARVYQKMVPGIGVTFRVDGKVDGYKRGKLYTETLTPFIKRKLQAGIYILVEPTTLEELETLERKCNGDGD